MKNIFILPLAYVLYAKMKSTTPKQFSFSLGKWGQVNCQLAKKPLLAGRPARTGYDVTITNKLGYPTKFAISAKDGYVWKMLAPDEVWKPLPIYTEMDAPVVKVQSQQNGKWFTQTLNPPETNPFQNIENAACGKITNGPFVKWDYKITTKEAFQRSDYETTFKEDPRPFTKTKQPQYADDCREVHS